MEDRKTGYNKEDLGPKLEINTAALTSLPAQWSRFRASTAGRAGSIPGQGTKIPTGHTEWPKQTDKYCYLCPGRDFNKEINVPEMLGFLVKRLSSLFTGDSTSSKLET